MKNTIKKDGRPTRYKSEYAEQSYKLCLLGYTDKELATFFNVCEATINNWKLNHKEFLESLTRGKDMADGEIVDSLYNRALGYEHPDTHISNYMGEITKTKIIKHYPPDTTAAIFWLKNRQSGKWRDKPKEDSATDAIMEGFKAIADKLHGDNN